MDLLTNNKLSEIFSTKDHPLADALLILYISVLGNYVGDTISPKLKNFISHESMISEYLILALMLFVSIVLQLRITKLSNMIVTTGMVMALFYVGSMYGTYFNMTIICLLGFRYTCAKFVDHYNQNGNTELANTLQMYEKMTNTFTLGLLTTAGGLKLAEKYGFSNPLSKY